MISDFSKYDIINGLTDDAKVINELSSYTKNTFSSRWHSVHSYREPLPDEPYVSTWMNYYNQSKQIGVYETLKSHLIQFRFPILKDISQTQAYKDATLRGKCTRNMPSASGLKLENPNALTLKIHRSIAGKIPVLIVTNDEDFVSIVRALSCKNEPMTIPKSMGAAMISGLSNWSRIHCLRKKWIGKNPFGNWNRAFSKYIIPNTSLYQDKLIVLSKKDYSGLNAHALQLSPQKWKTCSLTIRLEHECAHFFTQRYFGSMANNMHDELIADYAGISKVCGRFDPNWFLSFIGLENYPKYRSGARLENYLGDPPLSNEAFDILKVIIKKATINVAKFDEKCNARSFPDKITDRLLTLCAFDLLEMASVDGPKKLWSYHTNNYERKLKSTTKL
ncbi:DUF7005 family protein [Sungkyunkwania multivorans]|uniref:DUF7005 family protein n=1 Tax=Sungkyunkwania multivorans TaxID=1173618 RepID=A0ABW3D0E6_9FLAO